VLIEICFHLLVFNQALKHCDNQLTHLMLNERGGGACER